MSLYVNVVNVGGKIYERYLDDDLNECKRIVDDFRPSMFVENDSAQISSKYETIYGSKCIKKTFNSIADASKAVRSGAVKLLGQDDFVVQYISDAYSENVDLSRYLKRVRIANVDIEVPAPEFPSANESKYEITSIAHHDSVTGRYTVFVLVGQSQKWSKELSILDEELLEKVDIIEYVTEKELLVGYLMFWRKNYPAVITGYNTDGFDIPYLYNRYERVLGKTVASRLSPWNKVNKRLVVDWPIGVQQKSDELKEQLIEKGKFHYEVKFVGIESLDFLALYKKFSYTPQPSYRLDAIGESEVGENKIHFRHGFMEVYGKAPIKQKRIYEDSHAYEYYAYMSSMLDKSGYKQLGTTPEVKAFIERCEGDLLNVKEHLEQFELLVSSCEFNRCAELYEYVKGKAIQLAFQMVTDYNVKDVELVNRLDAKRGFVNLALSIAYYAKINFESVYSPIKTWDAIIFNSVKERKVVLPARVQTSKKRYIGGHVKDPIRGLQKMIASFDLESLYPSIIRQVNISPETFMKKQEPNLDVNNIPVKYADDKYPKTSYCIDELLTGNQIYDTSEYSMSPNGASFTKSFIGIIPTEITKVFNERKEWKRIAFLHKHNVQAIEKILKDRE